MVITMNDTNYIGGIVKILEIPKQKIFDNNLLGVKFRVQFPQIRNTKVVQLTFWGKLAYDVINYYKVNDYFLIEGYLSISNKPSKNLGTQTLTKVNITVFKIYPFFLSSNPFSS